MQETVIAVCDDQIEIANLLVQMIREIQSERQVESKLRIYTDGNKLYEEISDIDIVFLDIEMPQIDGIELGKKINEKKPECRIVMATGTIERFKEAFRIQAVRFITKPFQKEEVSEALTAVMGRTLGQKELEWCYQRNTYKLKLSEIQFIKSYNGYIECLAKDKVFRREDSLNQLEAELDEEMFYRVSKQYIINFSAVSKYKDGILQIGEEEIVVARRRRKDFERRYIEFDLKYAPT